MVKCKWKFHGWLEWLPFFLSTPRAVSCSPCYVLGVLTRSDRGMYVTLLYQTKYCSNCGKSVLFESLPEKKDCHYFAVNALSLSPGPNNLSPCFFLSTPASVRRKKNSWWQILSHASASLMTDHTRPGAQVFLLRYYRKVHTYGLCAFTSNLS